MQPIPQSLAPLDAPPIRVCIRCARHWEPEASFCVYCGSGNCRELAQSTMIQFVPDVQAMVAEVQSRIVPAQTVGSPVSVPTMPGGHWVAVEVHFGCRECGEWSPLDGLQVDQRVRCALCGGEQHLALEAWASLVDRARALEPSTSAEHGVSSQDGLAARMLLEPPECTYCQVPLVVASCDTGRIGTSCPTCGDARFYAAPETARARLDGLLGVVGTAFEEARRDACLTVDANRVVHAHCSECGCSLAALTTTLHCGDCGAPCRIPLGAVQKLGIGRPRASRWWMLLGEPKPKTLTAEPLANSCRSPGAAKARPRWKRLVRGAVGLSVVVKLGLAGLVLVKAHGMWGGAETKPTTGAEVANRYRWIGTGRAVLADVNRDGTLDVVGRAGRRSNGATALVAFDGKQGHSLWLSPEAGSSSELLNTPLGVVSDTVVVATRQADLLAFGLSNGAPRWQTKLTEQVDGFCKNDEGLRFVARTTDRQKYEVDVGTGRVVDSETPSSPDLDDSKQPTDCTPLPSDYQFARRRGIVEYTWVNRYRELLLRDRIMGVVSEEALHSVAADLTIGLAYKHPGSKVPMLVAYRWKLQGDDVKLTRQQQLLKELRGGIVPEGEPKIVWSTLVPDKDPLAVKQDAPQPYQVDLNSDTVVVAYEGKRPRSYRLTAFDLETGARRWDIGLPGNHNLGGVIASPTHAIVSRWSSLIAVDIETGELAWSVTSANG